MSWIASLETPGHITEAVIHFNQATDMLEREASSVEVSRSLFDALNKVQTEWVLHQDDHKMGEVKAFQTMISQGLEASGRIEFLESDEMSDFASFEPQIMDHDTLRRHPYRPDVEIEASCARRASEEHRKLVSAYNSFRSQKDAEVEKRVLKRAAELLYVVRSNIAHGEKTPYGPDIKKRKRDDEVCEVVIPLQRLLFHLLLDSPDRKLVTYGTLAPEEPNHDIVADLGGDWEKCSVEGDVADVDGLPVFDWKLGAARIEAELLVAPGLPKRWKQIDQFEGSSYKRRLITIITGTGVSVANVYLGAPH